MKKLLLTIICIGVVVVFSSSEEKKREFFALRTQSNGIESSTQSQKRQSAEEETIKVAPATSPLQKLTDKFRGKEQSTELIPAKEEIETYLENHPEQISSLPQILLNEDLGKRSELALIHTLENNPHLQAESVLTHIADSEDFELHQRFQAITSLGGRVNLSKTARDRLWKNYRNDENQESYLANAAILSLAVAASNYTEEFEADSEEIINLLEKELESPERKVDVGTILDALGNTASRSAVKIIERYIEHNDPSLREDAAFALREIPGQDIDVFLLSRAEEEEDPRARKGVVAALSIRKPSADFIHGIGTASLNEPDASLRRSYIQYLAKHRKEYPQTRDYMMELSALETNEENYELVTTALHGR